MNAVAAILAFCRDRARRGVALFVPAVLIGIAPPAALAAGPQAFAFGALRFPSDDVLEPATELEDLIRQSDEENLAFVAVDGIKSGKEGCGDALYDQRKALLESAKNGVAYVLAGRDWVGCTTEDGQSVFAERLNHLREVFFSSHFMLGESKLPQSTQSAMPQFRMYEENRRWQIGAVQFATLNVPAENNHFLPYAGRNGEFEDRVVANRAWLKSLFALAERRKSAGIVLFMDGDPHVTGAGRSQRKVRGRDGFLEIRKQLLALAAGYRGEVLVVHGDDPSSPHSGGRGRKATRPKIRWNANLGELSLEDGSLATVHVGRRHGRVFVIGR